MLLMLFGQVYVKLLIRLSDGITENTNKHNFTSCWIIIHLLFYLSLIYIVLSGWYCCFKTLVLLHYMTVQLSLQ